MTWYPVSFLPTQYSDNAGAPYSGAVLKAYEELTNNVIPMATDYNGLTTATSFVLNALGFPVSDANAVIIPHIQENYKIALYPDQASADADSGAIWTVDENQIADAVSTAFLQAFSGDGSTKDFILSTALGNDEKTLMVFADRIQEYSTNGTFTTDTGWTKGTGWTIASDVATATGAISTDIDQDAGITIIEGESYTITFTVANQSAGGVIPKIGGVQGTERTTDGTYSETIIAGSTQKIAFEGNGYTGDIDDVSVTRVNSSRREILRDDEFTLDGTDLSFNDAPSSGTNNILVFAPSLLLGEAGASAAAAAISEANAAASAVIATNFVKVAVNYEWDDDTTMDDPTTGLIKYNHATPASVTAIAIDDQSNQQGNPDLGAWINTWTLGTLRIIKTDDPTIFAIYKVNGVTDNAGWSELEVLYTAGSGTLTDADEVTLEFSQQGIDGSGVGSTNIDLFEDVTDYTSGTTTTLTLSVTPSTKTAVNIFMSGVYQNKDTYELSGAVITFDDPIPLGVPSVEVETLSDVAIGTPSAGTVTIASLSAALATALLGNTKISGLTLSNDADTDHDILVAAGSTVDSTKTGFLALNTAMTKQIDATWAAGDDAGGLFTGTVAADTTYHVFLIEKDSDGSVDVGFDTSLTAANIPAGYTKYRRLGSVVTDASSNILPFYQHGNRFTWVNVQKDHDTTASTTAATVALTVPNGIEVMAQLMGFISANSTFMHISSLLQPDLSPNTGADPSFTAGSATTNNNGTTDALTNTSGQVRVRSSGTSGSVRIFTRAWTDLREI